jgi:hypothetical protein
VAALAVARALLAVGAAAPPGAAVHLDEESAIAIWDAASKTQHFIRRAAFRTQAKDFGGLARLTLADTVARSARRASR